MYNAFIENDKITGVAPDTIKEGALNIEITEEQYNLCEQNGINYFIYSDGNIIENPNYDEELIKKKQDYVRGIRNQYLVDYVDGAISNPLRWADMSQELRDMYISYRLYLLDYTEGENWWEQLPKTLDEWRE